MSHPQKFHAPLEAFRGIAAVTVALHHSTFVNGQQNGLITGAGIFVDFFFILSGFVMSLAYSDRIQSGQLRLGHYCLLRLARIYPLHLFVLSLWIPYIGVKAFIHANYGLGSDPTNDSNLWSLLLNLLLLHSMGLYDQLSWNYPSWSISVEFYTYIVFFAFSVLVHRYQILKALAFALLAGIFILILALSPEIPRKDLLFTFDFGFFRCLFGFFIGVAVYRLYHVRPLVLQPLVASVLEAVSVLGALTLIFIAKGIPFLEFMTVLWFAVGIYVFASGKGYISGLLTTAPFVFLGRISYSIYLLHALFFALADNVARFILNVPQTQGDVQGRLDLDTPYAFIINLVLILTVVAAAHWTYRHVELRGKSWFLSLSARTRLAKHL